MKKISVSLVLLALLIAGCATPTAAPSPAPSVAPTSPPQAEMANPASVYCTEQGGMLKIETRGDNGQFGVCYFEDNLQCEEWAMLRGDCPVGGIKVTGYITDAARYCAITGGTYTITGNSGADNEQGTCTLKDGTVCDVWDYYNGKCSAGTAATPSTSTADWQAFTNAEVGYSLQVPPTWSQQTLPDQNNGAIHGTAYTGTEGGVEVYWGVGFGGACTTGTVQVKLAQAEVQACYTKNSDGTETWSQIGYEVSGGNSFSVRAYTSNSEQSSHNLVLQVLDTLTFMPPSTPAPAAAGLTIKPLTMEVCDGQAQAMAHTLEVLVGTKTTTPIIPTQSEEPLEDFVNNAKGTGCMATVTGTGDLYTSPSVVVDALGSMLVEQGWTQDPMLVADGPTGSDRGYRKGNQICWAGATWRPDPSANCPTDQPVSACNVPPAQQNYTITLNSGEEVPTGEASSPPIAEPLVGGGSTMLVFDSTRSGPYRDLYTMNSNGSDVKRLTHSDSDNYAGPWSPDGQKIVYTGFGPLNSYIAAINADGSGLSSLDSIQGSDEGFPDWSPDGKRIAFTSRRDGNNEVYLMNADGSNQVRLTNAPGDDFAPSWSPDGTQIVFVSDRDQTAGIYDLYIMNADGSKVKRLTNDTAIDYSPDWSPDGMMIAFRSDQDGQADIYIINIDGSGRSNLTNNPANEWSPTWSPDGKYIAFQTDRDGNWEVYWIRLEDSVLVNLTNDPGDDQMPFWRP